MSLAVFAVLLVLSTKLSLLGARVGVPAANLHAGMVVSAFGHATGPIDRLAPSWAIFAGFALIGVVLCARISREIAEQVYAMRPRASPLWPRRSLYPLRSRLSLRPRRGSP